MVTQHAYYSGVLWRTWLELGASSSSTAVLSGTATRAGVLPHNTQSTSYRDKAPWAISAEMQVWIPGRFLLPLKGPWIYFDG